MEQKLLNGRNYYLPKDVSEVITLVQQARQTKAQLRVTGANHSVNDAIYPDDEKNSLWVMLSHINAVQIHKESMTVDVEGGCHLGLDPFDPTGISTWENSLFYQLDAAGFALPDMGGIIHQSIAGFLSTGSSGGSTQYSFGESLLSLTFIPANSDDPEPVTVSANDENTDLFYAAGVSMGLFGIIVSARFAIIPKFNIKGSESITSISDCPIDMSGNGVAGKTSLQNFLSTTPYSRLLWYPQPGVERVTVWQAARMQPGEPFKRNPYQELPKILGSDVPAELAADLVYTGFGQYPTWLRNVMGGENVPAYQQVKQFIDQNFYSTIFPAILPAFVTEDKSKTPPGPQQFEDYWYSSLPMDNNMSDRLFPVEFTELWIPFDNNSGEDTVGKVLQALNQLFTDYYKNDPEISAGSFCTELYAAKASKFWMSPSYGSDVFRVDVFWFGHNEGSPADKYYPLFWNALQPFNFRCHWGKYLPVADGGQGVAYLQKQFPKWHDFLKLREQFDPQQVFVSDYWLQHLGIASSPKTFLMISPDGNNIYHPETDHDIVELVQQAAANHLQVRVRGAAQSVDAGIYTDDASAGKNINIMLNRMRQVVITPGSTVVTVQAGCNLGFDPFEPVDEGAPNDRSTETNGLFYLLQQNGLAIPNVTDAIHQTVGGFMSTGSAAGTTAHSFFDAVLSVKLVDGTGTIKTFNRPAPDNGDDPFYGVVISLGLMGIITEVSLQCVPSFNIIGQQVITADTEAEYDMFGSGNGKPSLQQYLGNTEFCRSIWWPFPTVRRIISWKARTMQPSDYNSETGTPQDFHPKPYQDAFYPSFLPVDLSDGTLKTVVETTTELVASTIYGLLGSWPKPLYDLCGNSIAIGSKTYQTKDLQLLLEGMWPFVLPKLLNFFAPVGAPQVFWDRWTGLANDTNEYSNNLLPAYRTEFWIPISQSQAAMQLLDNFYKNDFYKNANNQNRNFANGSYVVEILGAKQAPFWLSPSFGEDCLRINFYSLHQNDEDVYAYFGQFWKLFAESKIPFRLHWGYYLPQPGSSAPDQEFDARFPKFKAFAELRKTLDPENIFLTAYWKQHLNL